MGYSTKSECYSEWNVFQAGGSLSAIVTRVGEDSADGEVEAHNNLFLGFAFAEEEGVSLVPLAIIATLQTALLV